MSVEHMAWHELQKRVMLRLPMNFIAILPSESYRQSFHPGSCVTSLRTWHIFHFIISPQWYLVPGAQEGLVEWLIRLPGFAGAYQSIIYTTDLPPNSREGRGTEG